MLRGQDTHPKVVVRPRPVEEDGVRGQGDVGVPARVGHGRLVLVLRHRHRDVVRVGVPQVVLDRQPEVVLALGQ